MINSELEVHNDWNTFAENYNHSDTIQQTFYYTLVNILQLAKAKHVLEVACGTGKLLPYAVNVKHPETTYLATDLCQNMIEVTKKNLQANNDRMGVIDPLQKWLAKQNLTLKVADGELPIESPHKFDRIIANLVLQITHDPEKMLKNMHDMAAQGCLLGVTIFSSIEKSNFFPLIHEGLKAKGAPIPNTRTYFHLTDRFKELAEKTGWEIVVQWQQNSPFPFIEIDEQMMTALKFWTKGDQFLINYIAEKTKELLK